MSWYLYIKVHDYGRKLLVRVVGVGLVQRIIKNSKCGSVVGY